MSKETLGKTTDRGGVFFGQLKYRSGSFLITRLPERCRGCPKTTSGKKEISRKNDTKTLGKTTDRGGVFFGQLKYRSGSFLTAPRLGSARLGPARLGSARLLRYR